MTTAMAPATTARRVSAATRRAEQPPLRPISASVARSVSAANAPAEDFPAAVAAPVDLAAGLGPGGPGGGGGGASLGQTFLAQGQGGGGRGGGGRGGNQGDAAFNSRYMMELFITADNLFNRVNYGGYSGNLLSPYFGEPTMAQRAAASPGRDAVPVLRLAHDGFSASSRSVPSRALARRPSGPWTSDP